MTGSGDASYRHAPGRRRLASGLHAISHLTPRNGTATLTTTILARDRTAPGATRWVQLGLGLLCMMTVSSPQYVWALFTKPMTAAFGAQAAALQVTITILIVLQTFFSPFQGYLVQRFGPALLIGLGAALTGLSWVLASFATSLAALYLTYGLIGGLGTGIVYVGVVGLVMGWFPDRRGFAAGIVAAGYGMGAIVTTFPIADTLARDGLRTALFRFGLVFAVVGVLAAAGLRRPPVAEAAPAASLSGVRDVATAAMLRHPVFWLMFVMMALMSTTGLMVTTQMGFFAADFGVTGATVLGLAALPLALTIDRFCNGLTRPVFGAISDRIGRENTMFIAFLLEALAMTAWLLTRGDPVLFVLLSGVVFLGWGEIFSLFPSTLTDTFGTRHATTNYGCLYIAQGVGSVLGGPMASLLHDGTGSWTAVFTVAICADVATALLAIALLKPLRRRMAGGASERSAPLPAR
ncbi:oxalate/formate MFS antiporter [Lichenibacterium ramalinae]|uniref:Oxalate/formate MFS antiporter n=1 Tax=Lichenibacterium ramalinae TaxID=2316527 RepID=A0A4Q2R8K3_9HYPH|nr:oxalate/formate MFS antiporter [Lichenibacterium ramalinae]